jgi:hypothetical protein
MIFPQPGSGHVPRTSSLPLLFGTLSGRYCSSGIRIVVASPEYDFELDLALEYQRELHDHYDFR